MVSLNKRVDNEKKKIPEETKIKIEQLLVDNKVLNNRILLLLLTSTSESLSTVYNKQAKYLSEVTIIYCWFKEILILLTLRLASQHSKLFIVI